MPRKPSHPGRLPYRDAVLRQITVSMPMALFQALRRLAADAKVSRSAYIRRLIEVAAEAS